MSGHNTNTKGPVVFVASSVEEVLQKLRDESRNSPFAVEGISMGFVEGPVNTVVPSGPNSSGSVQFISSSSLVNGSSGGGKDSTEKKISEEERIASLESEFNSDLLIPSGISVLRSRILELDLRESPRLWRFLLETACWSVEETEELMNEINNGYYY